MPLFHFLGSTGDLKPHQCENNIWLTAMMIVAIFQEAASRGTLPGVVAALITLLLDLGVGKMISDYNAALLIPESAYRFSFSLMPASVSLS
jgi:hypothetical protein